MSYNALYCVNQLTISRRIGVAFASRSVSGCKLKRVSMNFRDRHSIVHRVINVALFKLVGNW